MNSTKTKQFEDLKNWGNWLVKNRHISKEVAVDAKLTVKDGVELRIPVFGREGELLFSKYRRAPWQQDGPKYRYEKGSTASLYGAEKLKGMAPGAVVLVCEGELDALALRTLGFYTVSTTGGAGTWRKEWSEWLTPFKVVFAYDADRAGIEGALKAASMTPGASIAWLPVEHGKDPTDIIHSGNSDALKLSIINARPYDIPQADAPLDDRLDGYKNLVRVFYEEWREKNQSPTGVPFHMNFAREWADTQLKRVREEIFTETSTTAGDGEMQTLIEQARQHPIRSLIKVSREGFANCVYHTEDTASMKVYPDNHSFSFCCNKRSDAIDIYRALNDCDFKTAVDALTS